jgi:hypothetical protein
MKCIHILDSSGMAYELTNSLVYMHNRNLVVVVKYLSAHIPTIEMREQMSYNMKSIFYFVQV